MDYKHLKTIYHVVWAGSFERAAQKLDLTQAAVSIRIKALQDSIGQPLLVRSNPARATEAGRQLLRHLSQVQALEEDLSEQLGDKTTGPTTFSLATNSDSLATWLLDALIPIYHNPKILLELYQDNEDHTHHLLRQGHVFASIGTHKKALQGCTSTKLGTMEYRLVATPAFQRSYFSNILNKEQILRTPIAVFDKKDDLQSKYLSKYFRVTTETIPQQVVPSPEGYFRVILEGGAYGLVPLLQCDELISRKVLVDLAPSKPATVDLYLQTWELQTQLSKIVIDCITTHAERVLA